MTKMKSFRLSEVDEIRLKTLAQVLKESETNTLRFAIKRYYEFMGEILDLPSENELIAKLIDARYNAADAE